VARSGRRPGESGTQQAILDAARAQFAQRGYDRATVRAIAAAAGVDPALVHHFYGTKQALFVATMALPFDPGELLPALLAPGLEGLGERLVGTVLDVWEDEGNRVALLGMVRSATSNEHAATMIREFLTASALQRVAALLPGHDAALRVELAVSHVVGLALARYVLGLEPLASAPRDELVAMVAPVVQRYLAGCGGGPRA